MQVPISKRVQCGREAPRLCIHKTQPRSPISHADIRPQHTRPDRPISRFWSRRGNLDPGRLNKTRRSALRSNNLHRALCMAFHVPRCIALQVDRCVPTLPTSSIVNMERRIRVEQTTRTAFQTSVATARRPLCWRLCSAWMGGVVCVSVLTPAQGLRFYAR